MRLTKKPKELFDVLTQIEKEVADKNEVDGKMPKLSKYKKSVPREKDLADGDIQVVDTGHATERYLYIKIGGELVKITATKQ